MRKVKDIPKMCCVILDLQLKNDLGENKRESDSSLVEEVMSHIDTSCEIRVNRDNILEVLG